MVKNYDDSYLINTDIIIAAILHDIVEDTDFSLEMIKLEFSSEISEIVSGLTRVKLDKKLTIPDSIAYVFNKQYSFFKNEKVPIKTSIALFFMDCGWPIAFYIVYFYCSNILRDVFHFSSAQIIQHNLIVACVNFLERSVLSYLSYKIYPLKIVKFKCIVLAIFMLFVPYLLGNATSPNDILFVQMIVIIFGCTTLPVLPIIYKHIPVFKRFTCASFTYAISSALIYIITSFGLIYMTKSLGHWGILVIAIPSIIAYLYAVNYFKTLEQNVGSYPN